MRQPYASNCNTTFICILYFFMKYKTFMSLEKKKLVIFVFHSNFLNLFVKKNILFWEYQEEKEVIGSFAFDFFFFSFGA